MKIRQVAPELSGIRDDHVNRYRFAADILNQVGVSGRVFDAGCGVGYGSNLIADECGLEVFAVDTCNEAITYACEHYASNKVSFLEANMLDIPLADIDAMTMFEIIEHSDQAPALLERASRTVKYLFGSVPNENVVPFADGGYNTEHYRHYTPGEIQEELENAGWIVRLLGSQIKKRGPGAKVNQGNTSGRTIVFFAQSKHSK